MSLELEGTIAFQAAHENPSWMTDGKKHRFPPYTAGGVTLKMTKQSDGTAEFTLTGIAGDYVTFDVQLSEEPAPSVQVVVTWDRKEVTLHLDGVPVRTKDRVL